MPDSDSAPTGETRLGGGHFYGDVHRKLERFSAIFTDLRHPAPRKLPQHSHELSYFGLLLAGRYGERYGRQLNQFAPFSLLFRPAGIPHQDEIGPHGVHFFQIELRPLWEKRIAECSGNLKSAREDRRGGPLFWLAMRLHREMVAATRADSLSVDSLLGEIVALAARLPVEEKNQSPPWLARILDKLHAEHCFRLTLEELSREARVHPVHLSRVFRRFRREGIGEYVHRLRLRTACTRMRETTMSLADISLSTGFADQSHFTRTFRKITGMTPSAFRCSLGEPVS